MKAQRGQIPCSRVVRNRVNRRADLGAGGGNGPVGLKFNPPPGWPLPWDFEPPPGWEPDPAWPPPPPGWPMWIGSGAPKILYQMPAGAAYVPGYMRESPQPEPSAARRRQFRWRPATR